MNKEDYSFATVQGIEQIALLKERKKILSKAAEELSELSTKILQRLNDKDKVSDESLFEEMVDVELQMVILKENMLRFDAIRTTLYKEVQMNKENKFKNSRDYKNHTK